MVIPTQSDPFSPISICPLCPMKVPPYGVTIGKAISLALDRVDSFDTKLDGIKAFKFTAVLDNQSLEQIKAEQEALKEEYKKNLNEHKKMLNQLLELEKSILSNHREELKKITRGHGA